jgi:hypothetical protein
MRAQKITRLVLVALIGWLSHWNPAVIVLALVASSPYERNVVTTSTPAAHDVVRITRDGNVVREVQR